MSKDHRVTDTQLLTLDLPQPFPVGRHGRIIILILLLIIVFIIILILGLRSQASACQR